MPFSEGIFCRKTTTNFPRPAKMWLHRLVVKCHPHVIEDNGTLLEKNMIFMYNKMTGPAPVDNKKIINNLYDPVVCLYLCLA